MDGCSETWWTHLGGCPQVQDTQIVGQKPDRPAAVGGRRPKRHRLSAQGLGQPEVVALKRHPPARLDPADLVLGAVGHGRPLRRVGPGADLIAAGGHGQLQALVRPDVVVLVPPGIERRLPGGQIRAGRLPREVARQGAVEALVLAQRLRVVGPTVADRDAQAPQPDGQRGVGMRRSLVPGTAVVDQQAGGAARSAGQVRIRWARTVAVR